MWFLLASVALADPCADPSAELQAAITAFEDAEVELAAEHLATADRALTCMGTPVDPEVLEDLYGFSAVVAYANGEQRATVESLMRLRTAFPDAEPHPMFGPELVELSDTWAERVGRPAVRVVLVDGDSAWVDGRPLERGEEIRVVAGEHLVQGGVSGGFMGVRQPLASATGITLSDEIWLGVPPARTVEATPDPFETPAPSRGRKRRFRGGLLATSAVSLAAGGTALGYAYSREVRFHEDPYTYTSFGGCAIGDACYDSARIDAIRTDALNVRVIYIVGYAATALGAGLLGTELFILPAPTADGATVGWSGRF